MTDRCSCGKSLGTNSQPGLPGTDTAAKCVRCVTADHIRHMLALLPDEDEREFERLGEWEQGFLTSIREQFARRNGLSEKQHEKLCQVYERLR